VHLGEWRMYVSCDGVSAINPSGPDLACQPKLCTLLGVCTEQIPEYNRKAYNDTLAAQFHYR